MKKIKNISFVAMLTLVALMGCMNSCTEELDLKSLPYLFRPISFSYTNSSTSTTFSWAKVDSAKSYTLEVGRDSANFVVPVFSVTLTDLHYTRDYDGNTFLANTEYFARIKANATDSLKNSKFNTIPFKSAKENLFGGYGVKNNTGNIYSAYMTAPNTLDIKWKPNSNVSHLTLSGTTYTITPEESVAGEKVITGLANSIWSIALFNGSVQRGSTSAVVEGDIIVSAGGDISAAITSAAPGQVILLTGGQNYTIGNAEYKFSKNVKIRSTSATSRSVVSMTTLTGTTPPSTTSAMMSIVASSAIDSLVFENIDFNGYCDNNIASTKIGYLFSNKTACTVKNITFTNCKIHNLGNTPFRLSGGTAATPTTSQRVSSLMFNGCIINETGFSSGYALVNISKSFDFIDNITIANSTLYNFSYPVISIVQTAATAMNSVTIQNCNFNQTTQNATSARVLFTFDYMNITSGISIKNCIFGSSGSMSSGLKTTNSTSPITTTITGCYYTSDFVDETPVGGLSYSIKSKMTSYTGSSTALWNNPVGGDFSLKDNNFTGKVTAGDLRW